MAHMMVTTTKQVVYMETACLSFLIMQFSNQSCENTSYSHKVTEELKPGRMSVLPRARLTGESKLVSLPLSKWTLIPHKLTDIPNSSVKFLQVRRFTFGHIQLLFSLVLSNNYPLLLLNPNQSSHCLDKLSG